MSITDARQISPADDRLRWPGAISLQSDQTGVRPWRLPHDQLGLFDEGLVSRAGMPAGVRLTFASDTRTVAGTIARSEESAPIDLVIDGRLHASLPLADRTEFSFEDLPAGPKTIELWLPQYGPFTLSELHLSADATLEPAVAQQPRWIAYGSSITQCKDAASPTRTWPAIVARELGFDLTCLGYGGQCHLDPSVARLMRDRPADYISVCAGINIYGGGSLSPRTFRPALIGFLQILRETHVDIPIAVMSPIFSPARETTLNTAGFTLEAMRTEVQAAVDALTRAGDTDLHYIDGLQVIGSEHAERLPDDLHPDAEGYQLMAQRYLDQVRTTIFAPRG